MINQITGTLPMGNLRMGNLRMGNLRMEVVSMPRRLIQRLGMTQHQVQGLA